MNLRQSKTNIRSIWKQPIKNWRLRRVWLFHNYFNALGCSILYRNQNAHDRTLYDQVLHSFNSIITDDTLNDCICRQTALYLAASQKRALMAACLAETMVKLNVSTDQEYNNNGDTLIHCVTMWGDDYSHVLEYLIRIPKLADHSNQTFQTAFDLNRTNHQGRWWYPIQKYVH